MTTKQQVLDLLEQNRGSFLSGEDLALRLSISRTAVWKAIGALREEGHAICAQGGRGYCLSPDSDRLSAPAILQALRHPVFDVRVLPETGSTNDDAKRAAESGAGEFTVIAAERQHSGKGRLGRSFYSPQNTGIYFSVILRPRMPVEDALYITTAAAAAAAEAIEEICGKQAGIKWVNDIFIDGKKVCGILTEASIDMESGSLAYAVLGIGVNVAPPEGDFPAELTAIAGSVCQAGEYRPGMRSRLLAAILDHFYAYYKAFPARQFLDSYRGRSILTGKTVTVHRGDRQYPAQVTGIDDCCRLCILRDGQPELLSSGEVSVRL